MSHTPYDAVLHAARQLPEVETALDAEMLGASLLGSVYAVAEGGRAESVRQFVAGFLRHTARRRTAAAYAARRVFAALVPQADGADRVRPGARPPAWAAQLGAVRPVSCWAYGDVFGDQTSYVTVFAYDQPTDGGGEHAVVALVDHNLGIVKDLFVATPADRLLAEIRQAADADAHVTVTQLELATVRARIEPHLRITDELGTLPEHGSLATDRMLVGARLARLPGPSTESATEGWALGVPGDPADSAAPEPATLVAEFLESPYGAALAGHRRQADQAVWYALRLILDFADDGPDGDPLRWSPTVVGLMLLDWVHRRTVLDETDAEVLPAVVRAWAAWAADRRGLPASASAAIDEAVEAMTPEFRRLHSTGERRGAPPG